MLNHQKLHNVLVMYFVLEHLRSKKELVFKAAHAISTNTTKKYTEYSRPLFN